jgi:hypothetical protein
MIGNFILLPHATTRRNGPETFCLDKGHIANGSLIAHQQAHPMKVFIRTRREDVVSDTIAKRLCISRIPGRC